MQDQPDSTDDQYAEIAESVRSGEYFRRARAMYDFSVHDPMVERYLYIFITVVAVLVFFIAFVAMEGLYPLSTPVPFIFSSTNVIDDVPYIHSLLAKKGEDPSAALLRFFVQNYVMMREEYNIDKFDRDVNGVESQSSPAAITEFQQAINPSNPASPITLYQRYSRRSITGLSIKTTGQPNEMEVTYEAIVEGKNDIKKSLWQANISFQYSGLALDEKVGKANPVSFIVTRYRTKRLQDSE